MNRDIRDDKYKNKSTIIINKSFASIIADIKSSHLN